VTTIGTSKNWLFISHFLSHSLAFNQLLSTVKSGLNKPNLPHKVSSNRF